MELFNCPINRLTLILIVVTISNFFVVLLALPIFINFGSNKLLDIPNYRKAHKSPIRQGAGIIIITSFAMSMIEALYLLKKTSCNNYYNAFQALNSINFDFILTTSCAIVIMILGCLDDRFNLSVLIKLFVISIVTGTWIYFIPSTTFLLSPIGKVLIAIGIVWYINLTNFMDGMDCLTASNTILIMLGLLIIMIFGGAYDLLVIVIATSLIGGMLGFIFFNKPPARVFLGDSGSLAIGFLIAICLVRVGLITNIVAVSILTAYPASDTFITVIKRLLNKESITISHNKHFFQIALKRGKSVWSINLAIILATTMLIILATLSLYYSNYIVLIISLIIIIILLLWMKGL